LGRDDEGVSRLHQRMFEIHRHSTERLHVILKSPVALKSQCPGRGGIFGADLLRILADGAGQHKV
jgi:hypothetical protein